MHYPLWESFNFPIPNKIFPRFCIFFQDHQDFELCRLNNSNIVKRSKRSIRTLLMQTTSRVLLLQFYTIENGSETIGWSGLKNFMLRLHMNLPEWNVKVKTSCNQNHWFRYKVYTHLKLFYLFIILILSSMYEQIRHKPEQKWKESIFFGFFKLYRSLYSQVQLQNILI